jgi:hypothetical protein
MTIRLNSCYQRGQSPFAAASFSPERSRDDDSFDADAPNRILRVFRGPDPVLGTYHSTAIVIREKCRGKRLYGYSRPADIAGRCSDLSVLRGDQPGEILIGHLAAISLRCHSIPERP